MSRALVWILAWLLMLIWSLGIRPFIPAALVIEPCIPLLVLSLMVGPLRVVLPFILLTGLLFDAFQPFPRSIAFFSLSLFSFLVWLAVRFILASRSFYSALILVILMRAALAGILFALGPSFGLFAAERAVLQNPLFFFLTTLVDACFLLIGFRLVARPLLGLKRVQIAR
ncbi:hypothetical protein KBD34_02095 [Patescibacteria group bacterium]|nr:hypothetical protein [Patescibacteria group bacterium]